MKRRDPVSVIILVYSSALVLCAILHGFVYGLGLPDDSVLRRMFDLGYEKNVPTWVSSQIWMLCAGAAFFCSWCDRTRLLVRLIWIAIAAVFLFASIDDTAEIHENVGVALRELLRYLDAAVVPWKGSPGSPWLGFYGPVIAAVLVGLVVFVRRRLIEVELSHKQGLVMLAAACFLTAMGMDYLQGMRNLTVVGIAAKLGTTRDKLEDGSIFVEEVLECLGGLLLSTAFLRYGAAVKARDTPPANLSDSLPESHSS